MSSTVLVVGSAVMDLVSTASRFPKPGETVIGKSFAAYPGGKGANQAVAVGRLGGTVEFVGCVGNDAYGNAVRESLLSAGVGCKYLSTRTEAPTGIGSIWVDDDGLNSIIVTAGANALVSPTQVREAIGSVASAFVLAQLEIPLNCVLAAAVAGKFFILDPAPVCPLGSDILALCDVITPNETETEALTGIAPVDDSSCERAGRLLLDRGVRNIVITMGSRGSYWLSSKVGRHYPAPSVHAIDTTAAGDAFNGALAMLLAQGREMGNAIAIANCVGAISTTRSGAQPAMPSFKELQLLAGPLL